MIPNAPTRLSSSSRPALAAENKQARITGEPKRPDQKKMKTRKKRSHPSPGVGWKKYPSSRRTPSLPKRGWNLVRGIMSKRACEPNRGWISSSPTKGCTLVSFLKRVLYVKEVHGAPTLRLPPGSPNGSFLTVTWIALYIKNMDVDLLHLFIYLFSKIPQFHFFQNPPNVIYLF